MQYSLNNAQKKAVTALTTPHLIIAGAGTGKTTVLTERIIYLIETCNINPQKIWIVTFTNKAINEIKNRISKFSFETPTFISTFHGSSVWILRRDISYLNRSKNFRIIDYAEQVSILKNIVKNIYCKLTPKRLSLFIKKIKDVCPENFDKENYEKLFSYEKEYIPFETLKVIYDTYNNYLLRENALDFEDLLFFANKLLDIKEVREYWNNFFDAILIDEFQDINHSQFLFVKKILGNKKNIFCVGDPDQSIYGFRGACPEICSEFIKFFPTAKIIKLEENFRSTQKILNVANTLINKDKTEFTKKLFTKNENGEDIKYFVAKSEEEEINWVLNQLYYLMKYENVHLSNCAILYRNHVHAINLEKELLKRNVPYIIYGSIKFFSRSEIKNIIAYLNLVFFEDSTSIERIINVPARSIGITTIEKLWDFCRKKQINLHYLLINLDNFELELEPLFSSSKLNAIKKFSILLKDIKNLNKNNLSSLVMELFNITGYKEELKIKLENSKIENIVNFASSLHKTQYSTNKNPESIIHEMVLQVYSDTDSQDKLETLNLSTVHNSKGLEFDYVFVIKMIEKQFPYYLSLEQKKISEERRLAYVAFTRAKKRLFLSASPIIDFQTGNKNFQESIFIKEIKSLPEFIKIHKHWN